MSTDDARVGLSEGDLAALFKAHDFSRMSCFDHPDGNCCPEGGCHDLPRSEHQYAHYERILADRLAARDAEHREAREETWDMALRWVRQQAGVTSAEYVLDRIDRAEPFNPYRAGLAGSQSEPTTGDEPDSEALCVCGHNAWTEHGGILPSHGSGCDNCDCKRDERQAEASRGVLPADPQGGAA